MIRASFELTTGRFTSLRWPEKELYSTACKCCLNNMFTNIVLLSSYRCFLSFSVIFYYFKVQFSAFVRYMMSFMEALVSLWIISLRVLSMEASLTCYCFSTVLKLLLLTRVVVSHVYCRQIARLRCVCLSLRVCLIWVKFVQKKLKPILPPSACALFSEKKNAVWANQRTRYTETLIKWVV